MRVLLVYIIYFFFCSFLGYIGLSLYTYKRKKEFINKGLLIGPIIPSFGLWCLIVRYLLTGYYNDPIVIFVFGLIFFIIIEYFINYILEKYLYLKFWKPKLKYNINNRTSIEKGTVFGILALLFIYIFNRLILFHIYLISFNILIYICIVLVIIFIIDIIISLIEIKRVSKIAPHLEKILNEYVKNKNIKLNKIKVRLFKAYPSIIKDNKRLLQRLLKLKKDYKNSQKLQMY